MTRSGMGIIASPRARRVFWKGSLSILLAIVVPMSLQAAPTVNPVELENLRGRIAELDRSLSKDRKRQDALAAELEAAERAIAAAVRERRAAEDAVRVARRELATATTERERAEKDFQRSRGDLVEALRASYLAGHGGRLQGLFQGSDAAAIDRIDVGTRAVAQAIDQRVQQLQSQTERSRAAEQALASAREALERRLATSAAALARLEKAQAGRRAAIERLARRSADQTEQLAQAKAEEARLQSLLEGLRQTLRETPMKFEKGKAIGSQKGRLPWPVRGKLLAKYGATKAGGALNWNGWWIAAPQGAPVRAVADGRAVYVGFVQRYGLVVILDHPGEVLSLYGHVQSSSVEVGESIAAGSTIASAGNSGGHEQSGVYFEIRRGTEPVDPSKWLAP